MIKKLFIHIPKNGGMSIRHPESKFRNKVVWANQSILNENYNNGTFQNKMILMERSNMPYPHARWRDIKPNVSKMLESFAIIRNPWARVVSRYTFGMLPHNKEFKGIKYTFDEFLDQRYMYTKDKENYVGYDDSFTWHLAVKGWFNAFDHVCDDKGRVRCDILRFEHYNQDVNNYFNMPNDKIHIRNVSNGEKTKNAREIINAKDYKEYYNEKQIQIVADWYKKDIEYWGFDFDTPATKNYWSK